MARFQVSQSQFTHTHADEALHRMLYCFEHITDLPLLPLAQDDLDPEAAGRGRLIAPTPTGFHAARFGPRV